MPPAESPQFRPVVGGAEIQTAKLATADLGQRCRPAGGTGANIKMDDFIFV
jgi:hypothetical protein